MMVGVLRLTLRPLNPDGGGKLAVDKCLFRHMAHGAGHRVVDRQPPVEKQFAPEARSFSPRADCRPGCGTAASPSCGVRLRFRARFAHDAGSVLHCAGSIGSAIPAYSPSAARTSEHSAKIPKRKRARMQDTGRIQEAFSSRRRVSTSVISSRGSIRPRP